MSRIVVDTATVEWDDATDGQIKANVISLSSIGVPTELTIASGAITVTGSYHIVDTESDASTDDLATISGGVDGRVLVLRAASSSRDVVVKDGSGNVQCAGDMTLDNVQDTITLIYDATWTAWLEIARSSNGA